MKIASKFFVAVIVLCALGTAAWGGYWWYRRNAPPGGAGRNMEIRLVAVYGATLPAGANSGGIDTSQGNQSNGMASLAGTSSVIDTFQKDDVDSYMANGSAPDGWKWLPVANGVEREVTGSAPPGSENAYVTRTSNGKMYLLTADRWDMTMTHASNVRPWGVDSVKVVTDEMGPAVEIHLDQQGGILMHAFTQEYVGHRIAVVVGGEICEVASIQSPVRSAIVVRLPAGQQAEAESLRDALMK